MPYVASALSCTNNQTLELSSYKCSGLILLISQSTANYFTPFRYISLFLCLCILHSSAREGQMAAVTTGGPFLHEVLEEESSFKPSVAVVFVGISLVLGIASRHLLRGTRVPYTVALLILGIALGSLGVCSCRLRFFFNYFFFNLWFV